MKRAIYPGSFDPVTFGHLDILRRASDVFDEVIIGVLNNSSKKSLFTVEERVEILENLCKDMDNVRVVSFGGLLVDFAKEMDAHIIIRGLRAVSDFEYELQLAQTNHVQMHELDTIFFATDLNYSYLSSTIVKEFASYGGDISRFVPEEIIPLIYNKYNNNK